MSNQIIDQQMEDLVANIGVGAPLDRCSMEDWVANIGVGAPLGQNRCSMYDCAGLVVAGQRLDAGVPFKKDDAEVLVGLAAILSFFVS